jgi:hypothetical protein
MKRESGHGEVMEKYQLYPEKEDLNKMHRKSIFLHIVLKILVTYNCFTCSKYLIKILVLHHSLPHEK